ncbi:MAG: M23 family metallopeptidase, partial [bacterium]
NQVIDDKNILEDRKTESEKKKKELLALKSQLQDKKSILDTNKQEKNKLLSTTKNQESSYKKILAEKKAKMEAFEKELNGYEAALKIAIDPKSIPKAGKGILSWPLDKIRITQLFGRTSDSVRLYASGTHNGVDFAASIGTPVKATLSGTIEGIGDTDKTCDGASYGKWVLIRHANGLSTLYAHFSLIKVQPGQSIATGEIIGYSGNTGYSTGPHLHMSVYATQGVKISNLKSTVCRGTYTMPIADVKAYLDPMIYL